MMLKFSITAFTLIECLLTIALGAILMIASVHRWNQWEVGHLREIVTRQLIADLQFAQQTALFKQTNVTICPAVNDHQCGEDWSKGLLIYLSNAPSPATLLKIDTLSLKAQQLQWHGWRQGNKIQFFSDGQPHGSQGSFTWKLTGQNIVILTMNYVGHLSESV